MLAYRGGKPTIEIPIKIRDTLSHLGRSYASGSLNGWHGWDLSGYLAGSSRGGPAVQRLETIWSDIFKVQHSIACNSATSGILAALAVLQPKTVHIPVMGMSAIAAVPAILGMNVQFYDLDKHYCMVVHDWNQIARGDVVLAVNLFGHPAQLHSMKTFCDHNGAYLVEDNAQGFNASELGHHCGTIGHIGIWSGNVHKPLNAGELGMLTTNDQGIAGALRDMVNHGECARETPGLNLRLTEITAALALGQIDEAFYVVRRSQDIAWGLQDLDMGHLFKVAHERDSCISAWYCVAIQAPTKLIRDAAIPMLQAEGLPCRAGYVRIDKMPAFQKYVPGEDFPMIFPEADLLNDHMILIETCSIDPTDEQIVQMSDALGAVGEELENGRTIRSRDIGKSRRKSRKRAAANSRSKESAS